MKSIANLEYCATYPPEHSWSEGQKEIIDHGPDIETGCGCNHGLPCIFHDRDKKQWIKEVMNRRY